jgi:ribose 5-phosphate isomerase B
MSLPTFVIGADHAGFRLKEHMADVLKKQGYSIEDMGCYDEQSVDYPAIAQKVALKFQELQNQDKPVLGLICCGSGIGIEMSANRFPWIRAAVVHDHYAAMLSRKHNDSNVISFGARVIAPELAESLLSAWLETPFEGGRHQHRIDLMTHLNPDSPSLKEVPSC